ncbi:hypothetical protein D3C72_1925180 [compost metagenome]
MYCHFAPPTKPHAHHIIAQTVKKSGLGYAKNTIAGRSNTETPFRVDMVHEIAVIHATHVIEHIDTD